MRHLPDNIAIICEGYSAAWAVAAAIFIIWPDIGIFCIIFLILVTFAGVITASILLDGTMRPKHRKHKKCRTPAKMIKQIDVNLQRYEFSDN